MWCFYYECLTAQNTQHTVNASNISLCGLCIEISIRLRVPTGGIPRESKSIAGGPRGMSSKPPAQEQIKSKMEFLICLLCLFFLFRKCKSPYCCSSPQHRSRPFNAAKCISELFLFIGHHFHLCFIFSSERACWQVLQINVEASALLIHN